MKRIINFLAILSLTFLYSAAQDVNLSGKVVDKNSNPISSVNVNLSQRGISTTTDAGGNFTLVHSSSGMGDLIRQGSCSHLEGAKLYFRCNGEDIRIDLYDISGRKIKNILDRKEFTGNYFLYPEAYIQGEIITIYFIYVRVGTRFNSHKLMYNPANQLPKGLNVFSESYAAGNIKKATMAVIDTLIFTHQDYETKLVNVESYTGDLGSVQMNDKAYVVNAPSSLNAAAVSNSQINLTWTDNSDNEDGFKIERSPNGTSDWNQVETVGANVTSFQNTGLASFTTYHYRVYAYKESSVSGYSDVASASTSGTVNAPSSLNAVAVSSSQINLTWTDNASNEDGLYVERSPNGSTDWDNIASLGANTTSYQNTGLDAITQYFYRVQAYKGTNKSGYSNVADATTSAISYNFPGGDLDDLLAVSPTLVFETLNINGELTIPSSEISVVITVSDMDINAFISIEHPICKPFPNSPDLTINASGTVTVDAPISLRGKSGQAVTSTATCNSCYGENGGSLTINAHTIYVNAYCHTVGGNGSVTKYTNPTMNCGCSAGDGGNIKFNASSLMDISAAGSSLKPFGGEGGSSYNCGNDGADGTDGILIFTGAGTKTIEETTASNMLDYNAQLLHYTNMTLQGSVGKNEEFEHRGMAGSYWIDFGGGVIDYLEDLFLLDFRPPLHGQIKLSVSPNNPNADLDLYLINEEWNSIIGQSNGAGGNENITTNLLSPAKFWVAVSFADDDPDNITTSYTLTFGD